MDETTDNRLQGTTDLFGDAPKSPDAAVPGGQVKPLFGESASPVPGAVPLFGGTAQPVPPAQKCEDPVPTAPKCEESVPVKENPVCTETAETPSAAPCSTSSPLFREKAESAAAPEPGPVHTPETMPPAVSAAPVQPKEKPAVLHPVLDVENSSLGTLMTSVREQAGYTVADAAAVTRIKVFYIEAIEKDRFEDLPSGSLPYAYIRTLCNVYGLDDEPAAQILAKAQSIQRTEAEFPAKIIDHVGSTITRNEKEEKRIMRLLLCAGAALVLLVIGIIGGLIWWLIPSGSQASSSGDSGAETSGVSAAEPGTVDSVLFDQLTAPAIPKTHELPVPGKKR